MLRLRSHGAKHDKKHNALTFCEHPRIDYHLPGQYIDFPFDIARILLLKIGRASGTAPSEKSSNPKPPSGGIFLSVMQRERRSLRPGHSCPLADTPRWRRRRRASGRVGMQGGEGAPRPRQHGDSRGRAHPPISSLVICMTSNLKFDPPKYTSDDFLNHMPIVVCMILEHRETDIYNWDAGVCDLILQVSTNLWQSLIAKYT